MGVNVQTRYRQVYTAAMTDVQTYMEVDVAPANTSGYGTIRRGYADQEDFKWTNVSGLQLTGLLRGLSPTALTDTEVIGLKKTHDLNSPSTVNTVEGTTLHYIINNKLDKDDDETVTGNYTFSHASGATITNGVRTSNARYLPTSVQDSNALNILTWNPQASAVNYIQASNAATGNNVILSALGSDTNINFEIQGKGTGYFIMPDGSQTKTNAAPADAKSVANKKYVDDQIAAASFGNASTLQKGVVQEATDAEVAAQTTTGSTGARLYINPGSVTVSSRTANKVVATNSSGKIDPNIYDPDRLYAPMESVIGENVSASDITNGLCLMYQSTSDMKWYKVTSTVTTWYQRLGILLESANTNDTGKRILLKGRYTGKTFSNINPTFASALTGTDNNVGDTTARALRAFVVSNTAGAEAVVTGGTISARQQGAPAGDMQIYLVLEQQEQANTPACFRDSTNNVARGGIIASATIAQALFSGTYQNLAFSFGGNIRIPAGCNVYVVVGKTGAADAANYYQVQSNAATLAYSTASPGWSGTANAGNLTLTVTSTSPVGYGVKVYTGSNGSFGLTPTNPWAPVIGQVISSTEMYFDPERRQLKRSYSQYIFSATLGAIITINAGFCPNEVIVNETYRNDATTDTSALSIGNIRGDTSFATTYIPSTARGNVDALDAISFLNASGTNPAGAVTTNTSEGKMTVGPLGSTSRQNELYVIRLETGYCLYNGFPSGANFVSGGAGSYAATIAGFALEART